mmetsp:Transcript_526/g.612  ORF Transcript_526/g.612 Transcript_526/m.612 type:complete len:113 (-) Transcript_526:87-425(-)
MYKQLQKDDLSSNMIENHIENLNKLGFEWDFHQNQWNKRYKELVTYVEKCGHTRVLNLSLGNWACRQRLEYKQLKKGDLSSKMTSDRIESLNKIGFVWDCVAEPRRKIYATL